MFQRWVFKTKMNESGRTTEAVFRPSWDWFHFASFDPSAKALAYFHLKVEVRLFDRYCISRFVFCNERFTKLIERAAFDFSARSAH